MEIQCSSLDNYRLLNTLGAGVSAKVKLAEDPKSKRQVAIKIFKEEFSDIVLLEKEILILRKLNHQNLVNMIEFNIASKYTKKQTGNTEQRASITMEYISGGELFDFIAETGQFSERVCRFYFRQLMDALDYIHGNGLAHRDLKPDNLLLDENYNLRVADFGMSGMLVGTKLDGKMTTYCGTLDYMAPEILAKKDSGYEGVKVDYFAAAKILFIMMTSIPPFPTAQLTDKFYNLIYNNRIEQFWSIHTKFQNGKNVVFTPEFKDFITAMWSYDPTQRPTSEQIRAHAWFMKDAASQEEINEEFSRRKATLDEEVEKRKSQKKGKQSKGVGSGGFRSSSGQDFKWGEIDLANEKLDEIYELYQTSEPRNLRVSTQKVIPKDAIVINVEPTMILNYLLAAKQYVANEIVIDPTNYSVNLQATEDQDEENADSQPAEYEFQIDFWSFKDPQDKKEVQDEEIYIDFQFIKGDFIEYLIRIEQIKSELKKL